MLSKHFHWKITALLLLSGAAGLFLGCQNGVQTALPEATKIEENQPAMDETKVVKTEEEWKKKLTPMQYHVTQEKGTERAFSGEFWNNHEKGVYRCVCCGEELFSSDTKFDSGTGWPSFCAPVDEKSVNEETDQSHGMVRTEVTCSHCGAHLGHVFNDGPNPTGLRYCINSASLDFKKKE